MLVVDFGDPGSAVGDNAKAAREQAEGLAKEICDERKVPAWRVRASETGRDSRPAVALPTNP